MDSENKTLIGKDIIESLTLGMYEDSRFIFREYIQNSADQIDFAVQKSILKSRKYGKIYIDIDKLNRQINFEDNATGIKSKNVTKILKDIAQSPKDRAKHKGFRGIGRLGGLAYCDKLIFETSYADENVKTILTWDAKKLRQIINDRLSKEEASDVIDAITTVKKVTENPHEHYFKVTLENVSNEILLDKDDIKKYLSMVAPVPLDNTGFRFTTKIQEYVKNNNIELDEYNIILNDEQIFKAYTNYLYEGSGKNKKKYDEILNIELFSIENSNTVFGWGWFGISAFEKNIPQVNLSRGIRLRKGNIQIGSEHCLVPFFREQRGNFYYIGEIHSTHAELIPNSRRDFFIENDIQKEFTITLSNLFKNDLHNFYYFASSIRGQIGIIKKTLEIKNEIDEKEKKGYKNKDEREKLSDKFDENKDKAIKAKNRLASTASENDTLKDIEKRILKTVVKKETEKMVDLFSNGSKEVRKIAENFSNSIFNKSKTDNNKNFEFEKITVNGNTAKTPLLITDKLSKLKFDQKKLLNQIFGIIDKVLPKDLSKSLIDKITEELK